MPPLPSNALNLSLEGYTQLADGSQFLICDEISASNQRIIIFAKFNHLIKLVNCTHIFMDGIFYCSPRMFDSLYTIHGEVAEGLIVPLVYVLSTSRSVEIYKLCFRSLCRCILEHLGTSFSPCKSLTRFL